MRPKNSEAITTFQKLQNRALRKITFKKHHEPASCVYKECKILKFPDILNLQNYLFMYAIQHNSKFSGSFHALHMYGKNSIKNHCIRDWNNLKKYLSDIPCSELFLPKTKSYIKQKRFVQYWTLLSLSFKYHSPSIHSPRSITTII